MYLGRYISVKTRLSKRKEWGERKKY
jgi:hypothetical protein